MARGVTVSSSFTPYSCLPQKAHVNNIYGISTLRTSFTSHAANLLLNVTCFGLVFFQHDIRNCVANLCASNVSLSFGG